MNELDAVQDAPAPSLDAALSALEAQLAGVERQLRTTGRAVRRARESARVGNVRDLARGLEGVADESRRLAQLGREASVSWDFPAEDYLRSDGYLEDLVAAAGAAGVTGVRAVDGRVYSYPHIVRPKPMELAVQVGKRSQRGVRPSHIAQLLQRAQSRPERDSLLPMLHAIESAYLLITGGAVGGAVPLKRLYDTLTLLPRSGYTLDDLVMDVYRLDRRGPHVTRSGRRFDLPASTSARGGGGIRFATREGTERLYSTIRFVAGAP